MRTIHRTHIAALLAFGFAVASPSGQAADSPTAKMALGFKPVQADIEYEIPTAAEVEKCTIKVERKGKRSGWVVFGPNGQVLRRFADTNGDNVVDQWSYYNRGIEVYRDLDTNNNNKVDQCRWLTAEGTRWGLDTNEDGKIDSWKSLSAEEASREAVRALVGGDIRAMGLVLVTKEDVTKLGISGELAEKVQAQTADAESKLKTASSSALLSAKTKWMRFDSPMPSVIPADQDQLGEDLTIYENAMAIVDRDGKPAFVHL
ncbi:MAG: thioredoxin, partial [Planctomycetales bacterium]